MYSTSYCLKMRKACFYGLSQDTVYIVLISKKFMEEKKDTTRRKILFEGPILVSISENGSLETKINRDINHCVNRSWWFIGFSTELKLWTLSWRKMSIINLESLFHSRSYYVSKYEASTLCVQGFIQLSLFYRINWGRQYKMFKQNRQQNGQRVWSPEFSSYFRFTGGKEKLIGHSFKAVLCFPCSSRYFRISTRVSFYLTGFEKRKTNKWRTIINI